MAPVFVARGDVPLAMAVETTNANGRRDGLSERKLKRTIAFEIERSFVSVDDEGNGKGEEEEQEQEEEWKKADCSRRIHNRGKLYVSATLVSIDRSIQSRRGTKISVSRMRFPSGIAAGPVPAEPWAAPSRRPPLLTILQIDSNVFKAILRDTLRGTTCVHAVHCHPYYNSSSRVRRLQ